ncbi:MAG TPA: hypothetical protein VER11_34260 [Polyangiaceae bacterium]|nr:hypothetical protein [Polyangiaceae bacterium]
MNAWQAKDVVVAREIQLQLVRVLKSSGCDHAQCATAAIVAAAQVCSEFSGEPMSVSLMHVSNAASAMSEAQAQAEAKTKLGGRPS